MFSTPQSRVLKPSTHPNVIPSYAHPHRPALALGGKDMSAESSRTQTQTRGVRPGGDERQMTDENSDSEVSSSAASPCLPRERRCFCGRQVPGTEEGIYCSVACARSDAFSSLCYKPTSIPAVPPLPPNLESLSNASSTALSRNASTNSSTSNSSDDWTASHYRRLARAESRRDERKEERKRRRADNMSTCSRSTTMSTSSSATRNVPDLVGGHSRNPSLASSISSGYTTVSSLSRNPSSVSTTSSRRYGGGVHVDSVIMEDDDEEEWIRHPLPEAKPYSTPHGKSHRRKHSNTGLSTSRRKKLEGLGMGKDMRDVLEEIIRMERGFSLPDQAGDKQDTIHGLDQQANAGLYTTAFDRPPRTPSPMLVDRTSTQAPGAPMVHRRSTVFHSADGPLEPTNLLGLPPLPPTNTRPPSWYGAHQSSLSESHTALYLATASPTEAKVNPFTTFDPNHSMPVERRSASPKLQDRKSLTFTPECDGPSIATLPMPLFRDSMNSMNLTPSKRRGNNISPSAFHPSMDAWRFPSSAGTTRIRTESGNMTLGSNGSATATPTRPPPITTNLPATLVTPSHGRTRVSPTNNKSSGVTAQLLWPPSAALPPPLAPALFPCSPANATPDFLSMTSHLPPGGGVPNSGMRLGVLLGSGSGDDEDDDEDEADGDVDMDMDEDGSTAHGHGAALERGYLPVFLEAEGFRGGAGW